MNCAYLLIENQNEAQHQLLENQSVLSAATLFHEEREDKIKTLARIFGIDINSDNDEHFVDRKTIHYKKLRRIYKNSDIKLLNKAIKKKFNLSFIVI